MHIIATPLPVMRARTMHMQSYTVVSLNSGYRRILIWYQSALTVT
jgi:hypothetical protein